MTVDIALPAGPPSFPFNPVSSFSPLVLADRLLTLAQQADRAGYHGNALRLLDLVDAVLENGHERH